MEERIILSYSNTVTIIGTNIGKMKKIKGVYSLHNQIINQRILTDYQTNHHTSYKATTIKALTRRICNSPDALQNETDHLQHVFHKNNYNSDFIELDTYKNNERNEINNPTTITATMPSDVPSMTCRVIVIPYIKGIYV